MENENKMRVYFTIENYGHSHTYSGVLDDGTTWDEVLNNVVATLEASYGYSFDIGESLGIYYQGKKDD